MWCTRFCFLSALLAISVDAHSRFEWPEARDTRTGIKSLGDCGSLPAIAANAPEIKPGPLTIWIKEAIRHNGSPWRLELSTADSDGMSCVLLDNIPHDLNAASPSYSDPGKMNNYFITVNIPDVDCGVKGCSILMFNPMTDKIGDAGAANAAGCKNGKGASGGAAECFSVYHSCTKPLKFLGTIAREKFPTNGASCWTQQPDYSVINAADGSTIFWVSPDVLPDDKKAKVTPTPNVYRRESATWSKGRLVRGLDNVEVNPRYNKITGPASSSYSQLFNTGGTTGATTGGQASTSTRTPETDGSVDVFVGIAAAIAIAFSL